MVQSIRQVINDYASQGMVNKEAAQYLFPMSQPSMFPETEYLLDACVYANATIGGLVRMAGGAMSSDRDEFKAVVTTSVNTATTLWRSHNRPVSPYMEEAAKRAVTDYINSCFDQRARDMFRKDPKYRDTLYAAMARAGMSRVQCRECLDKAVMFIHAQPHDHYTDEYLDGVVRVYKAL